ncbi:MAG: hypothetical protein ACUVXJ_19415 [Phycisphaerae bacterium]
MNRFVLFLAVLAAAGSMFGAEVQAAQEVTEPLHRYRVEAAPPELLPCEPLFLRIHEVASNSQPASYPTRRPRELFANLKAPDGAVRHVRFTMQSVSHRFRVGDGTIWETMVTVDWTRPQDRPSGASAFIFDTPGTFEFTLAADARGWRPASNAIRIVVREPNAREAAARDLFRDERLAWYLMERNPAIVTPEVLKVLEKLTSEYGDLSYGRILSAVRALDDGMNVLEDTGHAMPPDKREALERKIIQLVSESAITHPLREALMVRRAAMAVQSGHRDVVERQLEALERDYPNGLSGAIRPRLRKELSLPARTQSSTLPTSRAVSVRPSASETVGTVLIPPSKNEGATE